MEVEAAQPSDTVVITLVQVSCQEGTYVPSPNVCSHPPEGLFSLSVADFYTKHMFLPYMYVLLFVYACLRIHVYGCSGQNGQDGQGG